MEQKYPLFRQTMTSSDGKIYALGTISISPTAGPFKMRINKTWLTKLGLKLPQTIDDFEAALKAFVTKDPNGNGKADEIPFNPMYGTDGLEGIASTMVYPYVGAVGWMHAW